MLTSFATNYSLSDEEHIKINEIIQQLERINNKNNTKIIAEAKKEFNEMDYPHVTEDNSVHIPQAFVDAKGRAWLSMDLRDWFEKWFGDNGKGE